MLVVTKYLRPLTAVQLCTWMQTQQYLHLNNKFTVLVMHQQLPL